MLSPETVAMVNTLITSSPFLAAVYVILRRPARALIQLYSLLYLTPVVMAVYGLAVPIPGNLYAYFTGAPIFLTYGVADALVLLYALGSALAVVFLGVDQWADVAHSLSTVAIWLTRASMRPLPPRLAVPLGALITATINAFTAWYKYQAWPIVPLPSVSLQFSIAVASVIALEVVTWWALRKLKSPQQD